jgi:hypothetical protein
MVHRFIHLLFSLMLLLGFAGCSVLPITKKGTRSPEWQYIPTDPEIDAAASQESATPGPLLALLFCENNGGPERAFAYFTARKNHLMLSWMYLTGTGVKANQDKAMHHWEQCSAIEDTQSQWQQAKDRLKAAIDSKNAKLTDLDLFDVHTTGDIAWYNGDSAGFRAERNRKERTEWAKSLPDAARKSLDALEQHFAKYSHVDGNRVYTENSDGSIRNDAATSARKNAEEGFHELAMTLAGRRPKRRVSEKEVQAIESRRIDAVRQKRQEYATDEFLRSIRIEPDTARHELEMSEKFWTRYRDAYLAFFRTLKIAGFAPGEGERSLRFLIIKNRLRDLAGPWEDPSADSGHP